MRANDVITICAYLQTHPLNPDIDLDGQNDYNDLIPLDYDMDGDGL